MSDICLRSVPVQPITFRSPVYRSPCTKSYGSLLISPSLQSALLTKRHSSYSRSLKSSICSNSSNTVSVASSPSLCSYSGYNDYSSLSSSSTSLFSSSSSSSSQCLTSAESVPLGCDPLSMEDDEPIEMKPVSTGPRLIRRLMRKISHSSLTSFWKSDSSPSPLEVDSSSSNWQEASECETFHDVQLQTYRTVYSAIPRPEKLTSLHSSDMAKVREPRVNSEFLKFYALDYSCKQGGYLKITDQELDLYQQEYLDSGCKDMDEFLDRYFEAGVEEVSQFKDNLKLSLLSRDKLWKNVILPPRNDLPQYSKKQYMHDPHFKGTGLVRTGGKFMPWLNIDDFESKKSIPPYGRLSNGTQFTVKGWCNTRWSS